MGIQLGRPQSPSGTVYPFLGRSPFLVQGYSRNPLAVVHTTVAPKARRVGVAERLQTSKDLGTDTVAVDSGLAPERVAGFQLIHNLLQPIVYWAFQVTIGSKAIG
jgi:hypothetical protein